MTTSNTSAKRTPPTPEQVMAERRRQTEKDTAARKAALPAKVTTDTAVAAPDKDHTAIVAAVKAPPPVVRDGRTAMQQLLDDIAPTSLVGRRIKFGKEGKFETADDGEAVDENTPYTALCDQTASGMIKFDGEGNPPICVMGLMYDPGFQMPLRESLGDTDKAKWEIGLDGKPSDPWQHHIYLVLQRSDTNELFTFDTSSRTGRRAVGNLLKHYNRMQQTHPDQYPVVRLKTGGFQHRDDRVGWVNVPVLAVVGRAAKDSAAAPDVSLAADLNDEIGF
jgi:hypothetical protein